MSVFIVAGVLVSLVGTLIFTRLKPLYAFAGALLIVYFSGLLPKEQLLLNFVNESVISLLLLLLTSLALEKTRFVQQMAKSVLDAGWGQLKTMLDYKCAHAGIVFKAVNEACTTQTCSSCGTLPDSRPKGIAGLGIREWTCECGVTHNRDINAAKNILALGHGRPVEGITVSLGR